MEQEQRREIETYYLTAPIGLCVLDTGLRYLRINERLAGWNGKPAADHIGRLFGIWSPGSRMRPSG